jgi:hypothetical protein
VTSDIVVYRSTEARVPQRNPVSLIQPLSAACQK